VAASALESDEFLLYGVDANGHSVDIFPYGGKGNEDSATGDMANPGGIHGHFYRLVGSESKGSLQLAGSCRLIGKDTWTFTCESGTSFLSGVVFKGMPLTDKTIARSPTAERLRRAFLKQYQYGVLAAVFHCAAQCRPNIPQDLIVMWRGD
jgi:hypothetical protein